MKKTVVLNVVALSSRLIGEHTPFLKKWTEQGKKANIKPLLPAVTCSSQATYFTGKRPSEHGIVGNGWCFRDEYEIKFWRQSNKLVQAPKIWEELKKEDPNFTCANMFWWFNMNSTVDFAVTPRPLYPATGLKLPDVHSQPMDLRQKLQKELGQFPLFSFWGPNANIESTRWIADASMMVDKWHDPTLTLIYLPHLDYNLQRVGIDFSKIGKDLREIDEVCEDLITYYENRGAEVMIVSEYGITDVDKPVHINRILREKGYVSVKDELGLETLDTWASRAFAVADHQLAHIYIKDSQDIPAVKQLLEKTAGIELVLDEKGKEEHHLNHERAGDLVIMAGEKSWFTYYFWLDDKKAPDYARTVDIHRKPGYDPVETFADPKIKFLKGKIGLKLLKKKLGFRYLMDVIPLDANLVKGSHGRTGEVKEDWPVFITQKTELLGKSEIDSKEVYNLIFKHLK
ncbi:alkaline phosphatase family protein [Autumnicola psychrophila]|uniref:Alkaline phosphatase family protein n=1 Tax=Autumnicola psychrophila TaxID=3075592 RepID=A0ABU3DMQ8_9FLAO|nr:alkaline phosphatase family protein [Zunongwangia sp. F225]MDT0684966.1 alkaline phosphatase family protein [Zunongwangia sp. F225]